MKKKGFTLIEIIVAITLISIIGVGSVVGVKTISKNITINKLEQITDKILLAAEVYIETNKETYNQLYNNKNGVIIPLNVLVNEGLLDVSATKLNDSELKNNYVISMLSGSGTSGDCVDIKTVTSWNETSNEPIYICGNTSEESNNSNNDIKKSLIDNEPYYIAKGENPNNWVEFPVTSNTDNAAYFPNDSENDLWRILSIDQNGIVKLIYNKIIETNNDKTLDTDSCTTRYDDTFCTLKEDYKTNTIYCGSNDWVFIFNGEGFTMNDIADETKGKKHELIDAIVNVNYIVENEYSIFYGHQSTTGAISSTIPSGNISLKLGLISYPEIDESYALGKTWLPNAIMVGYAMVNGSTCNKVKYDVGGLYINALYSQSKGYRYFISPGNYVPVVTLKDNVKIVTNNCADGIKPGSKECPYKLECDNC